MNQQKQGATQTHTQTQAAQDATQNKHPFRIAGVATTWHHRGESAAPSHAEVIMRRWLTPHESDAQFGWPGPASSLVSMYIEQLRDGDDPPAICAEHHVTLAATVDEALTLGGNKLAVDGVMLIGEHGDYPDNEFGQKLYPRKELFDAIVATFRRCGRSVPVFCDKHFSWNFDWAKEMVQTAQEMGFILFGGSSIPHCELTPPMTPLATKTPREFICAYGGGIESYGYHSTEVVQALVEKRPGGEKGIKQVTAYHGESLKQAIAGEIDAWSPELYQTLLEHGRTGKTNPEPDYAFVVEYVDGLRAVHLHINPGIRGWTVVAGYDDDTPPYVGRVDVGSQDNYYAHFARLSRVIEDTMLANKHQFPVERVLMSTGTIAAAMRAGQHPGKPLPTPELAITY